MEIGIKKCQILYIEINRSLEEVKGFSVGDFS